MSFAVAQPNFSGPFPVLLELLEAGKLPISDVSLGDVADAFVRYVSSGEVPLEEVADFLVVAARLIYLKSRLLLPVLRQDDEEEEVRLLEERLRAYQEFEQVARQLRARWGVAYMAANPRRPERLIIAPTLAERSPEVLQVAFVEVLQKISAFLPPAHEALQRVRSVEEEVAEWRARLARTQMVRLRDTLAQAPRAEVVVAVMALLQLFQAHELQIAQEAPFGDVWITSNLQGA
jgi:segregation and condensation protein A